MFGLASSLIWRSANVEEIKTSDNAGDTLRFNC